MTHSGYAIIDWWSMNKHAFEAAVPMDAVFLHIAAGMAIYWVGARVFGGRSGPLLGWLLVVVAILANEAADLLFEYWPNRWDQVLEGIHDVAWTLALPTLALVLSRPIRPLHSELPKKA